MENSVVQDASPYMGWFMKRDVQLFDPLNIISQRKKEIKDLPKKISRHSDIENIVKSLNHQIFNFRTNEDRFQKKQAQKQQKLSILTNKISKIKNLIKKSKNIHEGQWKNILEGENVRKFLTAIYSLLFDIIQENLLLTANSSLSKAQKTTESSQYTSIEFKNNLKIQIRIRILMLVMDILKLIETVKLAFLSYTPQKLNQVADEERQEKKQLQDYLQKVKSPATFAQNYRQYGPLSSQIIYQSLKELAKSSQCKTLKLWFNIQDLKRSFITQRQKDIAKKQKQNLYQRRIENKLYSQWIQYSRQYRNSNLDEVESEQLNLYWVFKDYDQLFQYLLQEAVKEKNNILIINFFDLILGPWKQLDRQSAFKIFWEYLLRVNKQKQIKLPEKYISINFQIIRQACEVMIEKFFKNKQNCFNEELQNFLLNLSKKIVNLGQKQTLKEHYFQKNKTGLCVTLQKYKADKVMIGECKKKLKKSTKNNILQDISRMFEFQLENDKNEQQQAILQEWQNYFDVKNEKHQSIRHFLFLANSTNLEKCRNFYQTKRIYFLEHTVSPVGIIKAIQIVILEYITMIKIEEQQDRKYQKSQQSRPIDKKQEIEKKQEQLKTLVSKLLTKLEQLSEKYTVEEKISNTQQPRLCNFPPLLRKESQIKLLQQEFYIEDLLDSEVKHESKMNNFKDHKFTLKILQKIFEMKIEVIQQKVNYIQQLQKPLKQNFLKLKGNIYDFFSDNFKEVTKKEIEKLLEIEYFLSRKRIRPALWRLSEFTDKKLMAIQQMLEKAWGKETNILKIYIRMLIEYRLKLNQKIDSPCSSYQLQKSQLEKIIQQTWQKQKQNIHSPGLKQQLKQDIELFSQNQDGKICKRALMPKKTKQQRQEQAQQNLNIRVISLDPDYKILTERVIIKRFESNNIPFAYQYVITPNEENFDKVLYKLLALAKVNSGKVRNYKKSNKIVFQVQHQKPQFLSRSQLVKYLLKKYYETIQYCNQKLGSNLYPLFTQKHFKVQKEQNQLFRLTFNLMEGILLLILNQQQQLLRQGVYQYPNLPFVTLSNQLQNYQKSEEFRKQAQNQQYSEQLGFINLIEQIKALSTQQKLINKPNPTYQEILKATYQEILKHPYFWSPTQKFYQIVQFSERYRGIYQEQKVYKEKEARDGNSQKKKRGHVKPLYLQIQQQCNQHQKKFDIKSIVDKEASYQQVYKLHNQQQTHSEIQQLLILAALEAKWKGIPGPPTDVILAFNDFDGQIKQLRNLSVHRTYDRKKKQQISIYEKISRFQRAFPKIFLFIYRWKPFLQKSCQQLRKQKINLLCTQFFGKSYVNPDNPYLQSGQFQQHFKRYLTVKEFPRNYKQVRCFTCHLIINILLVRKSLFELLTDSSYKDSKNGEHVFYQALLWVHKSYQQKSEIIYQLKKLLQSSIKSKRLASQQLNILQRAQNLVRWRIKQRERMETQYAGYVCPNFILQLQMIFPQLFHDLRVNRYLWQNRGLM